MATPEIRFEGFKGEWTRNQLSDLVDRVMRRNIGLQSKLPLTISAQYGLVDQVTYFNNQVASSNMENYLLLYKGDFAYNKSTSNGYPWGAVKRLDKYDKGALSVLYIAFRPKSEAHVNSGFLVSYFESDNWHREVQIRASEGARNHGLLNISATEFLEISLSVPSANEEQLKIEHFTDNLLKSEQQQRDKVEKIKLLKQSMLVKMFPQGGASVPEVRFEGFTADWGLTTIGDITSSFSGGTPLVGVSKYYGGDIPFIRSAEINKSSTELFLTAEGVNSSSARIVPQGIILYALYGATSGEVGISKLSGAINQAILAITPRSTDTYFLHAWFKGKKNWITETYLQGGQGNLSAQIVKSLEIQVPSPEEQTAIGSYFRQLDQLIELEETKLAKLTQLKTAFLSKMFV